MKKIKRRGRKILIKYKSKKDILLTEEKFKWKINKTMKVKIIIIIIIIVVKFEYKSKQKLHKNSVKYKESVVKCLKKNNNFSN